MFGRKTCHAYVQVAMRLIELLCNVAIPAIENP
jgi:hypothetical protein